MMSDPEENFQENATVATGSTTSPPTTEEAFGRNADQIGKPAHVGPPVEVTVVTLSGD